MPTRPPLPGPAPAARYPAPKSHAGVRGFNPSVAAAKVGHYYAGPQNHFYRLLFAHGLTPRLLTFHEDTTLPQYGIGLTDLCKTPSAQVSHLPPGMLRAGRAALQAKLERFQPKLVCFNGLGVYQGYVGLKPEGFGLQPDVIGPSGGVRNALHQRGQQRPDGGARDRLRCAGGALRLAACDSNQPTTEPVLDAVP